MTTTVFDSLVEEYPAFWIDFLGEYNHIGGLDATRWMMEKAQIVPGTRMLDCGAFVGATARLLARERQVQAVATDIGTDFLKAGRRMDGGEAVEWIAADSRRLPFADESFDSVWALDTYLAPRELSRVAGSTSTLCLSCEVPVDARGGVEAFIEEWEGYGWRLAGHRQMSNDAAIVWRQAEAELVRHHGHFEQRYGKRGYLRQLDILGDLVRSYTTHEQGHGMFVFKRAP